MTGRGVSFHLDLRAGAGGAERESCKGRDSYKTAKLEKATQDLLLTLMLDTKMLDRKLFVTIMIT